MINRQDEIDELLNGYLDDKVGSELRNRDKGSDRAEADIGNETRVDIPPKEGQPVVDLKLTERIAREYPQVADEEAWEELTRQKQLRSAKRILTMWDLRQFIGFSSSKWVAPRWTISEGMMRRFRSILELARDETVGFGGEFYFVYLPSYEDVASGTPEGRDEVVSLVNQLGIPLIDFYSGLSNHPDGLSVFPYRLPGHYTAEGYKLLAELIIEEAFEGQSN